MFIGSKVFIQDGVPACLIMRDTAITIIDIPTSGISALLPLPKICWAKGALKAVLELVERLIP